ncbi:hypothetical protein R1flu_024781 [Riccia fluitans]|uniref:Reverse transcriptase domain-containing protein n=1 Tax=Riccia fluitans TaxID=41844 RepID=A0ABD1XVW2_9MARC
MEEQVGRINGLNIGDGASLMHQLFADDTGISITASEEQFQRLKEVIGDYEEASRARLNLHKSIVMPLKPSRIPSWFDASGCKLARPGMSFKYLGVDTSCPEDEQTIAKGIVENIMKKLTH